MILMQSSLNKLNIWANIGKQRNSTAHLCLDFTKL